mgnify:FL=1
MVNVVHYSPYALIIRSSDMLVWGLIVYEIPCHIHIIILDCHRQLLNPPNETDDNDNSYVRKSIRGRCSIPKTEKSKHITDKTKTILLLLLKIQLKYWTFSMYKVIRWHTATMNKVVRR